MKEAFLSRRCYLRREVPSRTEKERGMFKLSSSKENKVHLRSVAEILSQKKIDKTPRSESSRNLVRAIEQRNCTKKQKESGPTNAETAHYFFFFREELGLCEKKEK